MSISYGTGKEGAINLLFAFERIGFRYKRGRDPDVDEIVDIMEEIRKETADWPDGSYEITDDPNEPPIKYMGRNIFDLMKAVRAAKPNQ